MSCDRMRIEIVALLDENLGGLAVSRVRRHLQGCPACSRFYEEQQGLEALFKSAPELDLPVQVWERIESRLMSRPAATTPSSWFADLLLWPNFRYAFASAVLLALFSLAVLMTTLPRHPNDVGILADIRSYQIQVGGNPFMEDVEQNNPFYAFGLPGGNNPFNGTRSVK
jgi:anti-sigma factor RsiW